MFFGEINKINLQLVLETCLASLLISFPIFKRREHFLIKFIPCVLLFCVLGYFFPAYYFENIWALNILYWTFMYLCLLLFVIPGLLICFKMNFVNALLVAFTAYLLHHINNILASSITTAIQLYTPIEEDAILNNVMMYTINGLVLVITYAVFCYFYFEQRKENLKFAYNSTQLVFFGSVVVIFTIVISSVIRIAYYSGDSNVVFLIGLISNFSSCLLVMIFFFVFLKRNKLQEELQVEKQILEQSKKQYEISRENIDSLNIKFHDLKYRVNLLTSSGHVTKEDLKDIYDDIDVYDSLVKTGNKALDTALTRNALRCENNHIKFTTIADGSSLSFMSDVDIYVLFNNAISNAIEAAVKLKEEKRHISLIIKRKGNILSVELENFFDPNSLNMKDGKIETSKEDKDYHGYGLRSMKNIVKKYHGVMKVSAEEDIFRLTMTFVLENSNND